MAARADPSAARAKAAVGIERLLMKLRARDRVGDDEAALLESSVTEVRSIPACRTLIRAGVALSECTLLIDGIVCRYRDLADGQRQIMELHVPGDFLDLHSFLLKRLEHNVAALTPVTIALVPHTAVRDITESNPHLARMLWFSTLLDAAIHREKILSIGRRSAMSRIAHLFCELYVRLGLVELVEGDSYRLPLTQADLADATGLTSVHVNRMLKRLRDDELLTFRGGVVVIHDWPGLQRAAEFDPTYLYLERQPR
jgi:CRP-like cAMP-binding protein